MLSLSKKTDYALLALSYLARAEAGRAANTKEIAEQYDIPLELLAKILQRLAKAGMLASTPGPTGGYRLAKPAETISIGGVIETIDGPPAIAQCFKVVPGVCDQHTKCTIRKPLERINSKIFQMLNHISLAEIVRDDPETAIALMSLPERHTQRAEFANSL